MARPVSSRLTVVAALLSLAVLALPRSGGEELRLRATAAGALEITNSRDGQAVLTADGLRPGQSASGTLVLANPAGEAQRLSLATSDVADDPGRGGGVLSQRLLLRVEQASDGAAVYTGALDGLTTLDLADLAAGESRGFRITVTLPEAGPAVDDAFADARTDVTWRWTGTAETLDPDGPGTTVGGDPPPAPTGGTGPSEAPAAAPAPRPESATAARSVPVPRADQEGSAPAVPRPVRLWVGGSRTQRPGRSSRPALALFARCRPGCSLRATGRMTAGGRTRTLRERSLGRADETGASRLRFRLSRGEARVLRAALRRGERVVLTLRVRASAGGSASTVLHRIVLIR